MKTIATGLAGRWALGALAVAAATAADAQPGSFTGRFASFVDRLRADPSAPPGFAVVVVKGGDTVYEKAFGTRHLEAGAALTLDSPIYTASVTKSHVGLLAAQLDASGQFPLTATLRDVWPGATLPPPHDPAAITAAAFLSHSSGIEDGGLGWRYSETGEYRAADVPGHLAAYATPADRSFEYGNFGPVVYTAMVEARLGLGWRDALDRYVLRPLGLARTSARLEDLKLAETARCHTRSGGSWRSVRLKPTPLLNAGGGIYTSPRDAAAFLKAFASRGASTGGAIAAPVLARTWQRFSVQDRDFLGFQRTGYGLGWDISTYAGHRIVSRSGGYPGCRSLIAFVPDSGFGVVVLTVGDAGANAFNAALAQQAIDYWTGAPAADRRAAERLKAYAGTAAAAIAEADRLPLTRKEPPDARSPDYVGWYENKRLGRMAVALHPDGLVATAGELKLLLNRAQGETFQAFDAHTYGEPTAMRFRRDPAGKVDAFILDDDEFGRLPQ